MFGKLSKKESKSEKDFVSAIAQLIANAYQLSLTYDEYVKMKIDAENKFLTSIAIDDPQAAQRFEMLMSNMEQILETSGIRDYLTNVGDSLDHDSNQTSQ